MTEEREKFIAEMLQAIRRDISEMKNDITNLGLRQNATEHFEQGMMAHMAAMHSSVDTLTMDMRQVKARLELVTG